MMHHPDILVKLAYDRRNELLNEADAHRLVRQAERERSVQATLLERIVQAMDRLLNDPERQTAEQGSIFTDRAMSDGYH